MTKGMPYVAQGTHPENMTAARLDVNLPCVTARGIVDMGYAVAYPSPYGLVMISANDAEKMAKVKGELRQAYAILERLDQQAAHVPAEPPAKAAETESEVTDG